MPGIQYTNLSDVELEPIFWDFEKMLKVIRHIVAFFLGHSRQTHNVTCDKILFGVRYWRRAIARKRSRRSPSLDYGFCCVYLVRSCDVGFTSVPGIVQRISGLVLAAMLLTAGIVLIVGLSQRLNDFLRAWLILFGICCGLRLVDIIIFVALHLMLTAYVATLVLLFLADIGCLVAVAKLRIALSVSRCLDIPTPWRRTRIN